MPVEEVSTINYDGSQLYRYWMRADVQGESSFAFASASKLLNNPEYAKVAVNLLDYGFGEYRDGLRNDPESPSYGLLGWAITHKGNYYGDDNARYILGALGAAAFLNVQKQLSVISERPAQKDSGDVSYMSRNFRRTDGSSSIIENCRILILTLRPGYGPATCGSMNRQDGRLCWKEQNVA